MPIWLYVLGLGPSRSLAPRMQMRLRRIALAHFHFLHFLHFQVRHLLAYQFTPLGLTDLSPDLCASDFDSTRKLGLR